MGERAVALCWRPDGRYDRYYSQWGGRSAVRSAVLGGTSETKLDTLERVDWTFWGRESLPTVPATLDYLGAEAVYLLSPEEIGVALPLWTGLGPGRTDPTCGVLVRVTSPAEARHVLEATHTRKLVASDALAAGIIDQSTAQQSLVRGVSGRTVGMGETLAAILRDG